MHTASDTIITGKITSVIIGLIFSGCRCNSHYKYRYKIVGVLVGITIVMVIGKIIGLIIHILGHELLLLLLLLVMNSKEAVRRDVQRPCTGCLAACTGHGTYCC